MSFKEDVNNIELPKQLHERSKEGINNCAREKKKASYIKPTLLTTIVTAAMLLFVFSQLNGGQTTNVTTAALKDNGFPPIAISIAYIVTVIALIGVVFEWRKKHISRLLLILSFLAIMSTTWITSLKYTYQLIDVEVYPIQHMDFLLEDSMEKMQYSLHYMKPKSKDKFVLSIRLNDEPVSINHRLTKEGQERQFSLFNEYETIQFTVPKELVVKIKNEEKIKVRVLYTDYTQTEMELKSFRVIEKSTVTTMFSKSFLSSPYKTEEFQVSADTFIDQIHFPHQLIGQGFWSLKLNDEVIKKGQILEEHIDLSLSLNPTDQLKLHLEIPKLYQPLEEWIYFTENKKAIFITKIFKDNILDGTYLELIVQKQRGELREN